MFSVIEVVRECFTRWVYCPGVYWNGGILSWGDIVPGNIVQGILSGGDIVLELSRSASLT